MGPIVLLIVPIIWAMIWVLWVSMGFVLQKFQWLFYDQRFSNSKVFYSFIFANVLKRTRVSVNIMLTICLLIRMCINKCRLCFFLLFIEQTTLKLKSLVLRAQVLGRKMLISGYTKLLVRLSFLRKPHHVAHKINLTTIWLSNNRADV